MASDLTSSKEQIKEVKELLLRLINPTGSAPIPAPTLNAPNSTPEREAPEVTPVQNASTFGGSDLEDNVPHVQRWTYPGDLQASPNSFPQMNDPIENDSQTPDMQPRTTRSPSSLSGDTVPWTPNTVLQNFSNRMPIGTAVSTEVSASIGTESQELSPRLGEEYHEPFNCSQRRDLPSTPYPDIGDACMNEESPLAPEGVKTRGMASVAETEGIITRPPREKFPIVMLPRILSGAIAVNSLCYILHPDHGSTVVAEGRAGGSWKAPKSQFGSLCGVGEQMVQVHKILKPNLPLPFVEDRQPFTLLDHALVKPSGSSVYVKWLSKLLWKKSKGPPGGTRDKPRTVNESPSAILSRGF